MKGEDTKQTELFSYISIEDRIPEIHPLREIREMADFAIHRMNRKMKGLYSIRSEGQLMEGPGTTSLLQPETA